MSDAAIEQRIAEVLAEHFIIQRGVTVVCFCGASMVPDYAPPSGRQPDEWHTDHLAAVVAATCVPHIAADAAAQALEEAADTFQNTLDPQFILMNPVLISMLKHLRQKAKAYRQEARNE